MLGHSMETFVGRANIVRRSRVEKDGITAAEACLRLRRIGKRGERTRAEEKTLRNEITFCAAALHTSLRNPPYAWLR